MTIETLGAQTELPTLPHDGKTTEFDPTTGLVKLPVVVKKLTVHVDPVGPEFAAKQKTDEYK